LVLLGPGGESLPVGSRVMPAFGGFVIPSGRLIPSVLEVGIITGGKIVGPAPVGASVIVAVSGVELVVSLIGIVPGIRGVGGYELAMIVTGGVVRRFVSKDPKD
jgi:hypothetical protein